MLPVLGWLAENKLMLRGEFSPWQVHAPARLRRRCPDSAAASSEPPDKIEALLLTSDPCQPHHLQHPDASLNKLEVVFEASMLGLCMTATANCRGRVRVAQSHVVATIAASSAGACEPVGLHLPRVQLCEAQVLQWLRCRSLNRSLQILPIPVLPPHPCSAAHALVRVKHSRGHMGIEHLLSIQPTPEPCTQRQAAEALCCRTHARS